MQNIHQYVFEPPVCYQLLWSDKKVAQYFQNVMCFRVDESISILSWKCKTSCLVMNIMSFIQCFPKCVVYVPLTEYTHCLFTTVLQVLLDNWGSENEMICWRPHKQWMRGRIHPEVCLNPKLDTRSWSKRGFLGLTPKTSMVRSRFWCCWDQFWAAAHPSVPLFAMLVLLSTAPVSVS